MITLNDLQLAEIIGKEVTDNKVYWLPQDLPQVRIALRAFKMAHQSESFFIDAKMPYWLYLGIMSALAPNAVTLDTPNFGACPIPQNVPAGDGRGLSFRTFEDDDYTLIQFGSPRSLSADQLADIVPPAVNPNKGVIISSNAPYWVVATVGIAYANYGLWSACTQKYGGAIVFSSRAKGTVLGAEIDKQLVQKSHEKAAQAAFPKRGEIWLFDDGYGDHPGIILSDSARNEHAYDVLLVPLTTKQPHRHLFIARASTGPVEDSYAQCANISRIDKQQLLKGPMGCVSETVLAQVVRAVRTAIGDQVA